MILELQGLDVWRFESLVIRAANDRDTRKGRERAGGEMIVGVEGGLDGDLSHTRALLQATIACVVIVLKAWRRGPEPPL